jgi:DNA-directed RNA polymerase subunit F
MKHVVLVRNKQTKEALEQLNKVLEQERAKRARDAWFHGALWVLLKLPAHEAERIAAEIAKIQPDRADTLANLLSDEGVGMFLKEPK